MKEDAFIELAIKHLDAATSRSEVDQLGEAMLADSSLRQTYRELAQQSQLAHEWQSTSTPLADSSPGKRHRPVHRLALVSAAAAAVLALFLLLPGRLGEPAPDPKAVARTMERPDYFNGPGPSWLEIYPSHFDFPEFVWRSEFTSDSAANGALDEFADSGLPPLPAATPYQEFSERIAPIAMLPGGWESGDHLY